MSNVSYYDSGVRWDQPGITYASAQDLLPKPMSAKKVSYSVTDVMGFCDGIIALLNTHKTAMVAKGVDPTANITTIGTNRDSLNTENTKQETYKTQLHDQTALVDQVNATAYTVASNGADQVIAAFGSTSQVAKEARALRKSLKHTSRTKTPTPTPPTP